MRLYCTILLLILGTVTRASGPMASFTENKGQWPAHVLFRAMLPNGALFVERQGLTYVLRSGGDAHRHGTDAMDNGALHAHAYKVHFIGGSTSKAIGGMTLPHYENHFLGNDPSLWGSGCAVHGEVLLKDVWPGIDLLLSGRDGLKYELVVAVGADPSMARFQYEGHIGLSLKNGELVVNTTAGPTIEEAPVSFQSVDGSTRSVSSRYVLREDVVSFALPNGFDRSRTLTIDPTITFASYSGSSGNNFGFTATYDESGHLYGGGIVFNVGYPTTVGVLDPTFNGGTIDVGVSKWSPDGSSLVWSTYYGGSGNESPHSMVVNANDELFIFGSTGSTDLPTTPGCFDPTFGGGFALTFIIGYGYDQPDGTDMFVAHLNTAATALVGSTYIGGTGNDGINNALSLAHNYGDSFRGEIIVDPDGNAVVASTTATQDLPVVGGPQTSYGGAQQDGYVFRMDPGLSTMLWSTYVGGNGADAAYGVQVDSNGELFVAGGTTSTDLPMAVNTFQPAFSGVTDGFIMRYDLSGALVGSTHVGTASYDQCYFVQLNTNDEVFVVGQTHGDYPVTPGKYSNPGSSQFIHKFDHDLGNSQWSTRFGNGSSVQDLSPTAFLVSDCGQIYFSGWGGSTNAVAGSGSSTTNGLDVTPDAFQSTTDGSDFYLMLLEPEAVALSYATFFGGVESAEHVDGGTSRFDKDGTVYQAVCAGCQNNDDFPTTPGAWSNTNNATGCNLGVVKFELSVPIADISINGPSEVCFPAEIAFENNSSGGDTYFWSFGDGGTSNAFEPTHTFLTEGEFVVTMEMTDQFGCTQAASDTLYLTSLPPPIAVIEPVAPICPGSSAELFGSDALAWEWSPAESLDDPTSQSPMASPDSVTTYQLVVTSTCGTDTAWVEVGFIDPEGAAMDDVDVCLGSSVTIEAEGGGTYTWSPSETLSDPLSATPSASPMVNTVYTVEVITPEGCALVDSLLVTVFLNAPEPILSDTAICEGASIQLLGPEATLHAWDPAALVDDATGPAPIAAPASPTWFFVTASNACGTIRDSAFVDIVIPIADAWPDSVVCPGRSVQLGANGGVSFEWTPATGLDDPFVQFPVSTVNNPINYSVRVIDALGCEANATLSLGLLPPPFVEAGPDQVLDLGQEVQLNAIGSGQFLWEPSMGLDCTDCPAPIARPQESTLYTVTLTDANGCRSVDEVRVLLNGSLFVPNTFTPNGDGFNDRFGASGTEINSLQLEIFDRWGVLVFKGNAQDKWWDGTYNGQDAPVDVYVWRIDTEDLVGAKRTLYGHVTLVR
ncbi:MAG: gliding motility-associated C-terminal domain-containing protein [Flavobacteriales bacterium]|nr:gliding motility-associated C-terminal domain-containing protein [Flavobacteriales bacterium]